MKKHIRIFIFDNDVECANGMVLVRKCANHIANHLLLIYIQEYNLNVKM